MTKEKLTKKQKERERRAVSKRLAKEKTEAVAVMVKKYKMSEEEVLKVWQHFHILHVPHVLQVWQHFHDQNPDGDMTRESFLNTMEVNFSFEFESFL